MRKFLINFFKYGFFLAAGLFLVWWQLKDMTAADKANFWTALKRADYLLILPVVVMSLLSHLSRSMRWKLLLEPLGYKPKLKNVFAVTMVGYVTNSAIPRLGEIVKCSLLAKYENLKVDKLVGSIVVERMFDLLCFLIFITVTVLVQLDLVGNFVQNELSSIAAGHGMPLWIKLLLFAAIVISIIWGTKLLLKRYPHNKYVIKFNSFLVGLGAGIMTIKKLKRRKLFVAHTIFIWAMYLLQIYIGFYAMEGTTGLSLKAACGVLSLATLAMIATPNGIGLFPILVMKVLLIYGITYSAGLAFGWLMWGVSTAIIVFFGVLGFLALPLMNKNSAADTETTDLTEQDPASI